MQKSVIQKSYFGKLKNGEEIACYEFLCLIWSHLHVLGFPAAQNIFQGHFEILQGTLWLYQGHFVFTLKLDKTAIISQGDFKKHITLLENNTNTHSKHDYTNRVVSIQQTFSGTL